MVQLSDEVLTKFIEHRPLVQRSLVALGNLLESLVEFGLTGLDPDILNSFKSIASSLEDLGFTNPAQLLRELHTNLKLLPIPDQVYSLLFSLTNIQQLLLQQFNILSITSDMVKHSIVTITKEVTELVTEGNFIITPLTAFLSPSIKSTRSTEQFQIQWIAWAQNSDDLKPLGFVVYNDRVTVKKIGNNVLDFESSPIESTFYNNSSMLRYNTKTTLLQQFQNIALKPQDNILNLERVLNTQITTLDVVTQQNYDQIIKQTPEIQRILISPNDTWDWHPESPVLTTESLKITINSENIGKQIVLQLLSGISVELLIMSCTKLHDIIPESKSFCHETLYILLGIFRSGMLVIPALTSNVFKPKGNRIFEDLISAYSSPIDSILNCYQAFLLVELYQSSGLFDSTNLKSHIQNVLEIFLNEITSKSLSPTAHDMFRFLQMALSYNLLTTINLYTLILDVILSQPKKILGQELWSNWLVVLGYFYDHLNRLLLTKPIQKIRNHAFLKYYRQKKDSLEKLLISFILNRSTFGFERQKFIIQTQTNISSDENMLQGNIDWLDIVSVRLLFQKNLTKTHFLDERLRINLLWRISENFELEILEYYYFITKKLNS